MTNPNSKLKMRTLLFSANGKDWSMAYRELFPYDNIKKRSLLSVSQLFDHTASGKFAKRQVSACLMSNAAALQDGIFILAPT